MSNPYFRNLSEFDYVNRTEGGKNSGDYIRVKNLFKKGVLREDIFQNLSFFTKYIIRGDDRPDTVANEVYGDSTLDWVVLLANNITNIQSEWPMSQADFNTFITEKYDNETVIYSGIHHYEADEIKTSGGVVIIPSGIRVGVGQSVSFYDDLLGQQVTKTNIASPITNYIYEDRLNNAKRNIFILKPQYLQIVFDDIENIMQYKEGSTQYVSETLARGDNIRLYD